MNENTISTLEQGQASAKGQFDKTMSGLKDGINNATAGVEQAQATMRDGMGKVMKTAEDMMTFSQGNLEALTKSSQIFATGMQDLSQGWAAMARASMDDMMGTMRAMTSVKSIKDVVELQSSLLRTTMEKAVAQTGQMAERSMKVSEQAFAPIGARLTLATEKLSHIG